MQETSPGERYIQNIERNQTPLLKPNRCKYILALILIFLQAFSAMDFHGRGFVTLNDFLTSNVVTRLKLNKIDTLEFLKAQNLFNLNDPSSQVTFEKISRSLFPQMY